MGENPKTKTRFFVSINRLMLVTLAVFIVSFTAFFVAERYIFSCKVSLQTGDGFVLVRNNGTGSKVARNGDFSFTLEKAEDIAHLTFVVRVDGVVVEPDENGVYTIKNVKKNMKVTVDPIIFGLEIAQTPNGTITASATGPLPYGSSVTFTMQPDEGYALTAVVFNGEEIPWGDTSYTVAHVNKAITVSAVFQALEGLTHLIVLPELSGTEGFTINVTDPEAIDNHDGTYSVEHKTSFAFSLVIDAAYSNSDVVVNINNNDDILRLYPVTSGSQDYVIDGKNVVHDINITVVPLEKNTYQIIKPSDPAFTIQGLELATHGEDYYFMIQLNPGYTQSVLVVTVDSTTLVPDSEGIYTIPGSTINSDKTIVVTGMVENEYTVTRISGTGYTITRTGGGSDTVGHGENYTFSVSIDAGYENSYYIVKVNENILSPAYLDQYIIYNITSDVTITVEGVTLNSYYIVRPDTEGVIFSTSEPFDMVQHGDSYTFKISMQPSHSDSFASVEVYINGVLTAPGLTTATEKSFEISDIKSNKVITVTGAAVNTYTVTRPSESGFIFQTSAVNDTVQYNGSYSFSIDILGSHNQSTATVMANGLTLTPTAGVYTIPNITEDKTITVSGLQPNIYTVTPPTINGFTFTPTVTYVDNKVPHGTVYSFNINVLPSYNDNSAPIVSANGVVLSPSGTLYSVEIIDDTAITVAGMQINTYTITRPVLNGFIFNRTGSDTVEYGDPYIFSITLENSHSNSTPVVTANSETLTRQTGETGTTYTYTISGITENKTILVTGVTKNTYSITVGTPANGTISPSGSVSVSYGDDQTFTLTADSGYKAVSVIVDGGTPIAVGAGTTSYTLYNITQNRTFSAVFDEDTAPPVITYTVTVTSGTGFTIDSSDPSVVDQGADYTFTVTKLTGYTNATLTVRVNGTPLPASVGNTYQITNIQQDVTITVDPLPLNTYGITSPSSPSGYTYTAVSSLPVTHGSNFTFSITLLASHSNSTPVVTANSVTLTRQTGETGTTYTYTIVNVQAAQTISVNGMAINTYTITRPTLNGFTFSTTSGSDIVNYNNSYTFSITLLGSHSNSTPVVTANGTPLTRQFGQTGTTYTYTISGIIADTTILVTGMTVNTYNIVAPTNNGEGFTYNPTTSLPVSHGSSFTFTVALQTAYNQSVLSVYVDSVKINPVSGVYTISNVTSVRTVTVDPVDINTYEITRPTGLGFSFSTTNGSDIVEYNDSYTFTISLLPSHSTATLNVYLDGTAIQMNAGSSFTYTISNITANRVITIDPLVINTYTVAVTQGANGNITPTGNVTVDHGSNLSFALVPAPGYYLTKVVVDGTDIAYSDGVYTLTNITKNMTFSAAFAIIPAGSYTITVVQPTGYGGTISPATSQYAGGSSPTFNMVCDYGWKVEYILIDGAKYTTQPLGSYTFTNLSSNHTISVAFTLVYYTITYNTNGGNPIPNAFYGFSFPITSGSKILPDAYRAEYNFAGWYDNPGLTGSPVSSIPYGTEGDKEFWAKWTAISISWTNISNATQLKAWMNDGTKYARLTANINLNNELNPWVPWGQGTVTVPPKLSDKAFTGIFDGQGFTVSGVNIVSGERYVGFFGKIADTAIIRNLTISGSIKGTGHIETLYGGAIRSDGQIVGGIVGYVYGGTIENCTNMCTVEYTNITAPTSVLDATHAAVGGIAGTLESYSLNGSLMKASVINSQNGGAVTGSCAYVGGIAGQNGNRGTYLGGSIISNGYITNCTNTGNVTSTVTGRVIDRNASGSIPAEYLTPAAGGIAGINGGTIENCTNGGTISGRFFVGGLVGDNWTHYYGYNQEYIAELSASTNNGTVTNLTNSVSDYTATGGLAGCNTGWITGCKNIQNISGHTRVGGIAGYNGYVIEKTFNLGNISGTNDIGGAVGFNEGYIILVYNYGGLTGAQRVGGIAGSNDLKIVASHTLSLWYCINYGIVTITSDAGGGLVGYNYFGIIQASINVGTISGGASNARGAIIGVNAGEAEYCYYLNGPNSVGRSVGGGTIVSMYVYTTTEFGDGTVRDHFNNLFSDIILKQVIGTDPFPLLIF